jgi:PIN domain nuclease of toxin-antitoxin system
MPMSDMEYLVLDTHVWVWLINGDDRLRSSKAVPLIEEAAKRNAVKVSVMSVWEVGMLVAKQRLDFRMDVHEWVRKAIGAPGISLLPLCPDVALESSHLPDKFHGDPVDRLLVASTRNLNGVLVTRDQGIINYANTGHVNIIKA